ncbi:MAG: Flp family type IVb pilin [Bacillota bacterium]
MRNLWARLLREESGQGMAEYGLILALVAIALLAALGGLSGGLDTIFEKITGTLETAASDGGAGGGTP